MINKEMMIKIVSKDIRGKLLHHAYVIIKREGFRLNVNSLNDTKIVRHESFYEADGHRINVDVVNSIIKRSWIG